MSRLHEMIDNILKDFAKMEVNLSSEAARKMIADRLINECLSKGKTFLLEEVKSLRQRLREIEGTQIPLSNDPINW